MFTLGRFGDFHRDSLEGSFGKTCEDNAPIRQILYDGTYEICRTRQPRP